MLLQKDEAVIRLFCFYQQGGDAALTTATIGRAAVTRSDSRFWKAKVLTWLLKPKLDFPWRLFFFFVIFYYLQSEDHIWSGCCVYSCRVYSCCHLSLGYHSNQTHILKKKTTVNMRRLLSVGLVFSIVVTGIKKKTVLLFRRTWSPLTAGPRLHKHSNVLTGLLIQCSDRPQQRCRQTEWASPADA